MGVAIACLGNWNVLYRNAAIWSRRTGWAGQ